MRHDGTLTLLSDQNVLLQANPPFMDPLKTLLPITLVGGLATLASYALVAQDYAKHDYWVGISRPVQYLFYGCWVLAALGFIWYILSHLIWPPNDMQGIFSYGSWIRPLILGLILACSALWSVFIWLYFNKHASKVWASSAVIVTGVSVILLLAGEAEAGAPWHRILGLLLFAVVTVIADPIMWNAKFILYKK